MPRPRLPPKDHSFHCLHPWGNCQLLSSVSIRQTRIRILTPSHSSHTSPLPILHFLVHKMNTSTLIHRVCKNCLTFPPQQKLGFSHSQSAFLYPWIPYLSSVLLTMHISSPHRPPPSGFHVSIPILLITVLCWLLQTYATWSVFCDFSLLGPHYKFYFSETAIVTSPNWHTFKDPNCMPTFFTFSRWSGLLLQRG